MELYVNGNPVDIQLENEKTIGDVLRAFEEECAKINATTVSIFVDGKQIRADIFDETAKCPLEENTKIELGIISLQEINASFKENAKICRSVASELEQIPVQLQSGKDKDANLIISSLADLVDDICHTASLSALFPEAYNSFSINGKKIAEFFSDLSAMLTEFEHALQAKDTVLVGDLAEYELSPRLIAFADAAEVLQ
ncbi:MAG: hypothetical protein K6G80_06330 [Treponema sp.]|nr:hypothetical protein [Treponema sp.]